MTGNAMIRRRQRFARTAEQRKQWCKHEHTPYRGKIPCTGPLICTMCGLLFDPDTKRPLPNQEGDNDA